jgi:hypothetical protein
LVIRVFTSYWFRYDHLYNPEEKILVRRWKFPVHEFYDSLQLSCAYVGLMISESILWGQLTNVLELLIFVCVQPFDHTVRGALSPPHTLRALKSATQGHARDEI